MTIHLGYEIGTGKPVEIPLKHTAVTGMTQESGKTTTLEALVSRAGVSALAFVTKRGESSFANGRRVQPYFRDRADWQFVSSILDATLQEKNKFLRPWIMKICRSTQTLAEVQAAVRLALRTAKGIHEGVYTQLDAYLDLIVPEITRTSLARSLDLVKGLNVMDISGSPAPMQMLFVQSAIDWITATGLHTVVIIPEAWEFIPEGKGSPCKASAISLVRKGAGIGNFIWVDSQDMAGVDKTILRGCAVWLIGVQREANEVKRTLDNIPAGISKPKPADLATLSKGQFYACWAGHVIKTYVQPAWMQTHEAQSIACGYQSVSLVSKPPPKPIEDTVTTQEAEELKAENDRLKKEVSELKRLSTCPPLTRVPKDTLFTAKEIQDGFATAPPNPYGSLAEGVARDVLAILLKDPAIIKLQTTKPELEVTVERKIVRVDGSSFKGRVAKLLAEGFFKEPRAASAVRSTLKRTGTDPGGGGTLYDILSDLKRDGFLVDEGRGYREVPDMKVNIIKQ